MDKKEIVNALIDEFNFHEVNSVMRHLNWKWHSIGGVPSVNTLRNRATEIIENLIDDPDSFAISTGGFRVERLGKPSDPYFEYNLSFCVDTNHFFPNNPDEY